MVDPFTMEIATAVTGKVAETMTEQAQHAVAAIAQRIREKLRKHHPADLPALEAPAEVLAPVLEREFAADPAFRDEIRALWLPVAPAVRDDGVSNVFTGKADKVIQLRDVHGDLTIN